MYVDGMVLWVLMALMTGAAVLAVLWPLSKPSRAADLDGDVPFYREQLAEIGSDRDRGLIAPEEAEAARIESGRRMLRALSCQRTAADSTSEPALRRRRAASALALSIVPIIGLALYGGLGSPQLPAQPAATRVAAVRPDAPVQLDAALRQVEGHLAANPDDGRGWDVVAPIYLRLGRFADALRSFRRAREIGGDNAARLLGEAEALVGTQQGRVTAEAAALFEKVVALEPASAPARYYLALAREQAGDRDAARSGYRVLLSDASDDAPWLPVVRDRLARLDGAVVAPAFGPSGTSPAPVQRLPAGAVTPEIQAMVGGLDERLRAGGGSEEEWTRLVRSLVVLDRRADARDRLAKAKTALAGDPAAVGRLDRLSRDLDLGL
ncbi:c-type cytochrome biogenesis protein CcmI [Enterovirga rhinocerotis]|uniref:Cytochrome c-type biogenesis protein CcmH n=1 Tax=Enterovirga rhinocerotis TaxID=1339210 RepID=A0A4R7BT95_9HYPH|nr:c-type cytochrome biogenesis protein CcmI [Enterovirga rhinocerotis]TDR88974.1 cytochrome c-type biogenesis protein CcmH [Enterovirga rhinocerotis]